MNTLSKWLLPIVVLLQSCVTPIELKKASTTQLELLESVEGAVTDLQAALAQFHVDMEARIREEGRMLIARQSVDVAASDAAEKVSADGLYDIYKREIQPWVDHAFSGPIVDSQIVLLEQQIHASKNPVVNVQLTLDLEDLRLRRESLKNKPGPVAELESIIQGDLENEQGTAETTRAALNLLRTQVALMKAMHEKVDAWLTIDVKVSQQQADALKEAFKAASQKLQGGQEK